MTAKELANSTISSYSSQMLLFGKSHQSVDRFRNITSEQIINYLTTKVRPNTRRHAHSALKLFYTNIVNQPNKFNRIPYAKKERKLPQPLEIDEILGMLDVCKNTKHRVIVYLLYGCGFRIQELIDLKWSHIDRASNVIYVIQGKGKKDRKVQLFPQLIELLEKYYFDFNKECRVSDYVLKGQSKPKYSDTSINNVLKKLAKDAGIRKNVHAHILRHSYASHMLESGINLRTIQELLGHENCSTTEIYTHISVKHIASTPSPMELALYERPTCRY